VNLARSSVAVYIANASSAALGFGGIVLFARELGATTMGAFFLFQAAGGGLRVLADFGVTAAVKKRLSEHGGDNTATLSTAALVKTVLISLIVGGILLGSGWINGYLGATLASWLALSIVVQEASVLAINVLQGELRVAESAVIRSVRRVVWVVIGFWLVVRGWGIHGVVAGYIAGFAVVAVV
jgi:O-antigen/teichoic acid export membrane protein